MEDTRSLLSEPQSSREELKLKYTKQKLISALGAQREFPINSIGKVVSFMCRNICCRWIRAFKLCFQASSYVTFFQSPDMFERSYASFFPLYILLSSSPPSLIWYFPIFAWQFFSLKFLSEMYVNGRLCILLGSNILTSSSLCPSQSVIHLSDVRTLRCKKNYGREEDWQRKFS